MEELEICKRCKNREISRTEGILCGLTHEKPNFENECPDYSPDEKQIARLKRFEKEHNPKAVQMESVYKNLGTGLPLFVIGLLLTFGKGINQGMGFLILIGALCILIGLLFLIYASIRFSVALKSDDFKEEEKVNHKLRRKKLMKNAKSIFIFSLVMIPVAYLLAFLYIKLNGGIDRGSSNFVSISSLVIILAIISTIASGITWMVLKNQPEPNNEVVQKKKQPLSQSDYIKQKSNRASSTKGSDDLEVY
jgi:Na+/melibiose symporter-like transporter